MDPNNQQPPTNSAPSPSPAPGAAAPPPGGPPVASPAPAAAPAATPPANPVATNTMAMIAMVLAFLIPLAGLIVGILALKNIKKTGQKGHGLAVAAVIISAVLLVLQLLFVSLFIYALSQPTKTDTSSSNSSTSAPSQSTSSTEADSSSTGAGDVLANSQADSTLREDLIKAIAIKEKIAGRNGELEIVSITKQPKQGSSFVEDWTVKVDGVTTKYRVSLTPSAGGGTDYAVQNLK